jgi:hypothetical protein
MTTIERYKKQYGIPEESDNIVLNGNKVTIPTWLCFYMIHSSGIKSKKKRILKKVLKKQAQKYIQNYIQNESSKN